MINHDRPVPPYAQFQRDVDAPLYAQIQRDIEIGIAVNKLWPGDMVPAEVDLANRYDVSRVTVRQALGELVNEGLLHRVQGKGTFVSQPMIQRTEPRVTSFFYEMLESGRKPSAKVWSEVCEPDVDTSRMLNLDPGELVIVTRRLRYVDGEPIIYQINTTPESLCPGLVSEDLSAQSLQYTLEIKYGLRMVEIEQNLTSAMPDEHLAQMLEIPLTVPLLVDTRRVCGVGGVIIGRARAYFRGDRYTYKITRTLSLSGN